MLKVKERTGRSNKRKVREIPKNYLQMAAYYHWRDRGSPLDDPLADWLAAEKGWRFRHEHPPKKWWQTKQDTVPFVDGIFERP